MAEILSNQFTTTVSKGTQTTTKQILSNQFAATISRSAQTITKQLLSNQFTTTISRESEIPATLGDELSTVVNIYKKGVLLTPVSGTPTTDQYAVTITGTTNCTATLEDDNKTIKLLTSTSNTGRIDVSINIENKETYIKSIPVASITVTQEISGSMSKIEQKADKINLLVQGETASELTMTDTFTELISNNITLTADHINLNGYVSNENANWSIDNEGNMRAENLKIEGDVGADTLSVNYIDNPCYPATLAGSVHLYVNADNGNDDYTIDDILQSYDEAEEQGNNSLKKKFKTLQGALDASPAFLNNKNLRITLETNTSEDVYIRGFTSGAVRIYLNGKTIYGNVHGYASSPVYIYGGTVDNTTATQGVIHPNTGFNIASRCVSVGFESCQYVGLYKIKVFGADNKPSDISSDYKVAVASSAGTGSIYCSDVQITNCAIGFRTNNMGCIHAAKSSGKASRYGFESTTGGQISLADNNQAGGTTANTSESSGGQVWYKSPTFDGNTTSTDTTTAPSTSTTKTMIIKSSYGDTYRSSVYNNWKKDGTVRQGDYGYGDCTGCWFFGTAFAELKGKTITKVQIIITRQTGGTSIPVEHKLWMHRYTSRPSGAPTLTSGWSQTFRLATGNSTSVAITNSAVLNAISAGTCKGFAIRHTYDSAHYSVCSGSCTVKITYTE